MYPYKFTILLFPCHKNSTLIKSYNMLLVLIYALLRSENDAFQVMLAQFLNWFYIFRNTIIYLGR
jgi:hypothetical protein